VLLSGVLSLIHSRDTRRDNRLHTDSDTGKLSQASMVLMDLECKYFCQRLRAVKPVTDFAFRYNGTSDLQLERMNVYFNEVCMELPNNLTLAKNY